MDYANRQHVTSYMSLLNGIGKYIRREGNDIERGEYPNGYASYAFDLSPDLTDSESFSLARQRTVCVDMTFGEALPNTVTIVSYAEFENIIELDSNRERCFRLKQLMNTRESEFFLGANTVSQEVFQGVFSADTLPRQPHLLVFSTTSLRNPASIGLLFTWIPMGVKNTLIRLGERLINIPKPTWTKIALNGHSNVNSYRASSAVFVDIIVVWFVCSDVEESIGLMLLTCLSPTLLSLIILVVVLYVMKFMKKVPPVFSIQNTKFPDR